MGKRLGLLIGNSVYRDSTLARLAAPDVDVGDLADVLLDPEIGGFDDVNVIVNVSAAIARRAISDFFSSRDREDLLLLYFSCHGVLDENGRLYLAFKDTERQLLRATSISAAYITDEMNASRSQRQVLILDCCHSGAFARGAKGATGASVGTAAAFEGTGYGRVVLTATDATQYAWEDDQVSGEAINSLFTRYLVEGLQSGEADIDKDGRITVDELFDYIYPRVVKQSSKQTPGKWSYKEQGEMVIASSPARASGPGPARAAATEEEDELEARLARIYTRGLSAYWLEEWDRAEQAFQAVSEIKPDYHDTAVKLAEVQRQKKLYSLYQQALAASNARDWNAAITALQAIEREGRGYKDAGARLAEARKQKSLSDLYSQAQQLFEARQWQAVLNVFANIRSIEIDYPDPANLHDQAGRELEAEKRQKELEGRYTQAFGAMDARNWQEARSFLLQVQAMEPGYGETERLLKRVESELTREEAVKAPPPRPAETRAGVRESPPQAQAAGAAPAAQVSKSRLNLMQWIRELDITRKIYNPARPEKAPAPASAAPVLLLPNRSLCSILMVAGGWLLASAIQFWQGQSLVDSGQADTVWLIRFLVFGGLAGLVFWLVLRLMSPQLNWKLGLIIVAGWTLGALLVKYLGEDSPGLAGVVLMYAIGGLAGGLGTGWALRQAMPSLTIRHFWGVVLGCMLGFAAGGAMVGISAQDLVDKYGDTLGVAYALSLGSAIAGLVVAAVVIQQLASPDRQMIRWNTVLFGAAGFLLGDLVANVISPSASLYDDTIYPYLTSIGAIGLAFLSLPSRNPRRILLFGVLGLIGLPLGHWVGMQLFAEHDILVMICWGAGVGLALGLGTRSLPGSFIMTLFGSVATALTLALVVMQLSHDLPAIVYVLLTVAAGGVLALGWSFLGGDAAQKSAG